MKTFGPTMQCNGKTLDYAKCSKCPRLVITHARSLNHHRYSTKPTLSTLSLVIGVMIKRGKAKLNHLTTLSTYIICCL